MKGLLSAPFINGIQYSWGNIDFRINNVPIVGITKISYDEDSDSDHIWGAGRQPIGRGFGNITVTSSISLNSDAIIALQQAATAQGLNGYIQGILPFTIVVSYIPSEGQGLMITDTLYNCQFKKNMRSMSQGDKNIGADIELIVSHIEWGSI